MEITKKTRVYVAGCGGMLGLAVHKKGKLVTLDRGVHSLAGAAMMGRGVVEIL